MGTVTALKVTKPAPRKVSAPSKAIVKRHKVAVRFGYALGGIALTAMALSLSHQAHGISTSTSADGWESWAMGTVIDLGLVAAKLAPYIAESDKQRIALERYAKPLAISVLILSAYFNAAGFSGYVPTGYLRAFIDVTLGCAAPGIIFALSQMTRILTFGK